MNVAFPYATDARGRTAQAADAAHIRNMIEQLLFTAPGERVHRPDFGTALLQLVFAPNGDLLAAAVQASVQAALQQWIGSAIHVAGVQVESEDATLTVTVSYVVARTQVTRVEQFTRRV